VDLFQRVAHPGDVQRLAMLDDQDDRLVGIWNELGEEALDAGDGCRRGADSHDNRTGGLACHRLPPSLPPLVVAVCHLLPVKTHECREAWWMLCTGLLSDTRVDRAVAFPNGAAASSRNGVFLLCVAHICWFS